MHEQDVSLVLAWAELEQVDPNLARQFAERLSPRTKRAQRTLLSVARKWANDNRQFLAARIGRRT